MVTDMQQILAGMSKLNQRVQNAKTEAERQDQATQQELARSQAGSDRKGERCSSVLQQEQGIGAFASESQPFEGEDDKWREWARVFHSWSGRFFGGALAEIYEHVEGHRNEQPSWT